jgi:diguanylate cyclase (GGDEF)-like protein/excisionase family DNA binding protein
MSTEGAGNGTSPAVRHEAANAVRQRTVALVSDLSATLRATYPESFSEETSRAAAGLLLTLMTSALEHGELSPRAGAVHDLHRLCEGVLGARYLFQAVDHTSRIIADELALDDRLGAMSEPWPEVIQSVRSAAMDILAAFTTRLLDTPAHGSVRDPLTTLVARPVFDLALQQEVHRAHRHQGSFAIILFDVDNLSMINRENGYGVGDRILERLGILARRFFRTHDWVARHDEDSIVALLPETSLDQASSLATRFRETVQQRLVLTDHQTEQRARVTLSAAAVAAEQVQTELDAGQVLAEAEAAVLRAKLNGRNRTEQVALLPTSVTLLGAASILDCRPPEIRRLVRRGILRATRRGRHYLIDRGELERFKSQGPHLGGPRPLS